MSSVVWLLSLASVLLVLSSYLWLTFVAFDESARCGFLVLLLPVYPIFYVVTRWNDCKAPFKCFATGAAAYLLAFGLTLSAG